jgi:hypothetical protein
MDSYRAEKKATLAIALPDTDAEIEHVPTSGGGRKPDPEIDKLSNIIKGFNDQFAGLFNDPKAVEQRIIEVIPPRVSADPAYKNAARLWSAPRSRRSVGLPFAYHHNMHSTAGASLPAIRRFRSAARYVRSSTDSLPAAFASAVTLLGTPVGRP